MIRFSRPRARQVFRYAGLGLSLVVAMLAAAIVVSLTVDLGPTVREYTERAGSKQIERPMHIGNLKIHLLSGKVIVEDFSIDGLRPGDRPFFTAKRLDVGLDWLNVFRRRPDITISSVEMTDWHMVAERWEGAHNFPKFTRADAPKEERRFTTTLKYLRASRGRFTYQDHETPWSIVCPNLDITIGNLPKYHGEAVFTGGMVKIQNHLPMWANMKARFVIDGPLIRLERVDLDTDGATTVARGHVDAAHWPEQIYDVESRVDLPRMREIFFKDETWDVTGEGDFTGRFHLFKNGRDLAGTFTSEVAGVNAYRFPQLYGSLRWTPAAFDIWDAGATFYGGDARFTYSIKPLGRPQRPLSRFDASYTDVDLATFTDFEELRGLRFAGAASGRNLLEWPLGRFAEQSGEGYVSVRAPSGTQLMTPTPSSAETSRPEWGPFAPIPLPTHLPIGGELTYRYGPEEIEIEPSRFVTERTHVAFQGTTGWGEGSRIDFHVTSSDWQESDQVLAGIITDFGSPTGPVAFGGRGEFDGVMTGPFRQPRVEGDFSGEDLRAWDTIWGGGTGHIVVENGYVTVNDAVVRLDDSEIRAEGLFSLSDPRPDGREEIDARFRVSRRDLRDLRHAFQLDDYPLTGRLSGEFHLTGDYGRPIGFGAMTIDQGAAWGEPFQIATASLRFDGSGVRLDGVDIAKGSGTIGGAAFVGWDSTYSFNADGRRIPVERIAALDYPRAPLSGIAEFSVSGNGTFDLPRYDVRFRINDLFVAEEGVGQVAGTLALRGAELSGEIDAASPRLAITGTGRIALTPEADCEITFRFHDSSLDPYVRLFVPKLSPFTTAVASGSIRIVGRLTDIDNLLVDTTVDTLDMRLFDYAVSNAVPVHLALDQHQVNIQDLELVGEDTRLRVSGTVGLHEERIALRALGDANLGILQGFFRNVRGSGRAELTAAIDGPLYQPLFSGSATITGGRVRHFSLPNALEAINGTLYFDARGIRLDGVSATMGGGRVQFGGRIGFDGYLPAELNVTARGEDMRLRYPEGVRSTVDADLSVGGTFTSPRLGGTVMVKNAVWTRRIDAPGSIFDLARRASPGNDGTSVAVLEGEAAAVPLRFDMRILVPSTLRVETNLLRLVASADLSLVGSYDRPILSGRADIERGEVNFEGRRYRITRGTIDFTNPTRIEPFFDVEAETNVRVPGSPSQNYRILVGAAGTSEQLRPTLSSEPPLPTADVLALLFSDVRRNQDVELRALQNPNQAETDILTARATLALAAPISSEVGKVVEQTFGLDTFQLTPSLVDPSGQQTSRLNPAARLTIGKRISDRAYLTFSRSLGTTINDQIVVLEYEESDRLSWILSRNEDQQTYALEFRVRHTF